MQRSLRELKISLTERSGGVCLSPQTNRVLCPPSELLFLPGFPSGPPVMWGLGAMLHSLHASRPPWGGGGPTLPTSRSVSPTSTLSTQTLTSAALGLLPWVLPEPFVSLPPLHLSFHPSSLLSLSFVPRNSCPA